MKYTIEDAVEAYSELQRDSARSEVLIEARINTEILDKFDFIGLSPLRMQGRGEAVFEYEGKEVVFNAYKVENRY